MNPNDDAAAPPRRWGILAVLALSLIIISLDNTVLNVALPSMQRSLKATSNELQWIVDAYTLAFAGLVLLGGNLGDRYGRKGCLQIGLLLLAVGSILVVLSDSPSTVIAARSVMGVGGALIMPATLSITTTVFAGAERAKAIAVWAACAAVGVALGPVVGGWLVEHFWWGSVFMMNIPIALTALIVGVVLVPTSKDPAVRPPDLAGAALSTVGLTTLVYSIIAVSDDGWSSPTVVISFAAAVVVLGGFAAVEARIASPMLPLSLFRSRRFSVACAAIVVTFFVLLGAMYFLTQYLQVVRGYTSLQAGVRTLPLAIGLALAAPRSAALATKLGTNRVVAGGMLFSGVGMVLFVFIRADTNYGAVAAALMVLGLGMGTTMAPATESVMGAVPAEQAGVGSAVNDAARQLGSTLGVAVLGTILAARYSHEVAPKLHSAGAISGAERSTALNSVDGAHSVAARLADGIAVRDSADSAFVSSMHLTALVAAAIVITGAGLVARFLPAWEVLIAKSHRVAAKAGRYVARHRASTRRRLPGFGQVSVRDLSTSTSDGHTDALLAELMSEQSVHSS